MTLAMCSGAGLKQRSLHDSTWCLPTFCGKIANDVIGAPPRATWFLFVCQGQPLLHPWYLAGASFLPTGSIVFSSSSGFGGFFMMKKWDGFKSATMASQVLQSQDSDSRRQGLCNTALCDWNKVENPLCGLRLCWRKSMLKALCDQWCVRKNFISWLQSRDQKKQPIAIMWFFSWHFVLPAFLLAALVRGLVPFCIVWKMVMLPSMQLGLLTAFGWRSVALRALVQSGMNMLWVRFQSLFWRCKKGHSFPRVGRERGGALAKLPQATFSSTTELQTARADHSWWIERKGTTLHSNFGQWWQIWMIAFRPLVPSMHHVILMKAWLKTYSLLSGKRNMATMFWPCQSLWQRGVELPDYFHKVQYESACHAGWNQKMVANGIHSDKSFGKASWCQMLDAYPVSFGIAHFHLVFHLVSFGCWLQPVSFPDGFQIEQFWVFTRWPTLGAAKIQ